MPKKVQAETPKPKAIRLPSASSLSSTLKQSLNFDNRKDGITNDNSELMTDFKDNKHGDPAAFRVVKAMFKLSDEKLTGRLAHLLHYIEFTKDSQGRTLTERANAQGEMFETARTVGADGEPDLRPRHLRQPGASASDDERESSAPKH